MVVSFTIDRTRRSLNLEGYRVLFHLKSTFWWVLAAWTLAAAIVIAAALWFLNLISEIETIKRRHKKQVVSYLAKK